MSKPVSIVLLDKNHKPIYTNAYHSIRWAKKCIKELDIDYEYIQITMTKEYKLLKKGENNYGK